jgi:hypothetical protein
MGKNSHTERTLDLQVVLGSIAYTQPRELQHPPASASILGTSYYDVTKYKKLNKEGRVPMEDRKGPFEHFRPKSLVLSVSVQSTLMPLRHFHLFHASCLLLAFLDYPSYINQHINSPLYILFRSIAIRTMHGRTGRLGQTNSARSR